jgi:hypothetical protein
MSAAAAASVAEVRPALREAFRHRSSAPTAEPEPVRAEAASVEEEPAAVPAGGNIDPSDIEKPAYLRRRAARD